MYLKNEYGDLKLLSRLGGCLVDYNRGDKYVKFFYNNSGHLYRIQDYLKKNCLIVKSRLYNDNCVKTERYCYDKSSTDLIYYECIKSIKTMQDVRLIYFV